MKPVLKLLLCCAAAMDIYAKDTNVYPTIDPAVIKFSERTNAWPSDKELEEAGRYPESRPAESDAEGNWGKTVSGVQMSLRFLTNVIEAGKTAEAIVILRNTNTNSVALLGAGQSMITLTIKDQQGSILWSTPPPLKVSGPTGMELPALRQFKYHIQLENIATNIGSYSVLAARRGIPDGNGGWTEVRSDIAIIKVLSNGPIRR